MNHQHSDYPEQTCTKCNESWPADTEFFFTDKRKRLGLSLICKACFEDMPSIRAKRALGQTARLRSPWERLFSDQRRSA